MGKRRSWEDVGRDAKAGPGSVVKKIIIPAIGVIILLSIGLGTLSYVFGWFGEAAQVAQEQFGPREMLRKYEWFKNASASLDGHRANLNVYNQRKKGLQESYGNTPRNKWLRSDAEQFNVWSSESSGIAAAYNGLSAEYNAQMAKFNWAFANAGQLPQGATVVLPREYKPYLYGAE